MDIVEVMSQHFGVQSPDVGEQAVDAQAEVGGVWQAVRENDLEKLKHLLAAGHSLRARGAVGETIFHWSFLICNDLKIKRFIAEQAPELVTLQYDKVLVDFYVKQNEERQKNSPSDPELEGLPPRGFCYPLITQHQAMKPLRNYKQRRLTKTINGPYDGETALHIAIVNNNIEGVRWLVHMKPELLEMRAFGSFFSLAEYQKKQGQSCYFGELPLSFAVATNRKEMVRELLDAGAEFQGPGSTDQHGNGPFHIAVYHQHVGMYKFLREQVFQRLLAAEKGDADIAEAKLREIESEPNRFGFSPLVLAAHLGFADVFNSLLSMRATKEWAFGAVTCSLYPLPELDGTTVDKTSGHYVCRFEEAAREAGAEARCCLGCCRYAPWLGCMRATCFCCPRAFGYKRFSWTTALADAWWTAVMCACCPLNCLLCLAGKEHFKFSSCRRRRHARHYSSSSSSSARGGGQPARWTSPNQHEAAAQSRHALEQGVSGAAGAQDVGPAVQRNQSHGSVHSAGSAALLRFVRDVADNSSEVTSSSGATSLSAKAGGMEDAVYEHAKDAAVGGLGDDNDGANNEHDHSNSGDEAAQQSGRRSRSHTALDVVIQEDRVEILSLQRMQTLLNRKWNAVASRFVGHRFRIYIVFLAVFTMLTWWRNYSKRGDQPWVVGAALELVHHARAFSLAGVAQSALLLVVEAGTLFVAGTKLRTELGELFDEGPTDYFWCTGSSMLENWASFVHTTCLFAVVGMLQVWHLMGPKLQASMQEASLVWLQREGRQGSVMEALTGTQQPGLLWLEAPADWVVGAACYWLLVLWKARMVLLSLSSLACWMYSLWFLLGTQLAGPLVVMVFRMLQNDVYTFSSFAAVIIVGFTHSYSLLIQQGVLLEPISIFIRAMVGDMAAEANVQDASEQPEAAINNIFAGILVLVYVLLVTVLLLNILVAMLNDSYNSIKQQSKLRWLLERARIITGVEKESRFTHESEELGKYWVRQAVKNEKGGLEYRAAVRIDEADMSKYSDERKEHERLLAEAERLAAGAIAYASNFHDAPAPAATAAGAVEPKPKPQQQQVASTSQSRDDDDDDDDEEEDEEPQQQRRGRSSTPRRSTRRRRTLARG